MKDNTVYKRTAAVMAAVYLIITSIVSAVLLISRDSDTDNTLRINITYADLMLQRTALERGEKDLKSVMDDMRINMLNSMLSYGGIEAAVFDKDFNLITGTCGDWTVTYSEPVEDMPDRHGIKYASFAPEKYLSKKDIQRLRKYFLFNASRRSTKVGDIYDYKIAASGWIADNGEFIPQYLWLAKIIVDKSSDNGASLSMHEENVDFFAATAAEPESFKQKISSALVDTASSVYFAPGGKRGLRSDEKQTQLRALVQDSKNARAVSDARKDGTYEAITQSLYKKYNYSLNSYYSDKAGYHIASAYSYNVFTANLGMLAFLWLGSLVIFAAAAAVLMLGIRSNMRKRDKLEEQRRYLTNSLAHDLKAPLAVISGSAQNIKEGIKPQKHGEYTEKIQERAEYMGEIISEMLDMAQLDKVSIELDKSEFSLKSVAEELSSAYSELITNKKIQFSILGDATIQADKKLLSKVIDNFLVNALKYTPENGKISIEISSEQFTVYNSGSSVPEGMEDKIWDAYIKADTSRQADSGNGLGLYISASILRQHNFKYGACNTDNGFKIWFTFM